MANFLLTGFLFNVGFDLFLPFYFSGHSSFLMFTGDLLPGEGIQQHLTIL